MSKKSSWFSDFSGKAARAAGHPMAFVLVGAIVIVWLITGPLFGFSDTWQLVINTGSSIVTFLMVFLIQNTQNRDSAAIHIKLDELIRSIERGTQCTFEFGRIGSRRARWYSKRLFEVGKRSARKASGESLWDARGSSTGELR
jgi:low affinity Fe/Cu permease